MEALEEEVVGVLAGYTAVGEVAAELARWPSESQRIVAAAAAVVVVVVVAAVVHGVGRRMEDQAVAVWGPPEAAASDTSV